MLSRTAALNPEFLSTRIIQIGWLIAAAFSVSLAASGIGSYQRQLSIPCDRDPCLSSQLHTGEIDQLARAGLPFTDSDTVLLITIAATAAGFALLAAAFAIWRRPTEPAVISFSIVLLAFATTEFTMARGLEQPAFQLPTNAMRLVQLAAIPLALAIVPRKHFQRTWLQAASLGVALLALAAAFSDAGSAVAIAFSVSAALLVGAYLVLWQRSPLSPQAREQLVWAWIAFALFGGAQIIGRPLRLLPLPRIEFSIEPAASLSFVSIVGMALLIGGITCLGIALLREELIEADFVLNRTLVYGLLTIVVIASYVLIVGYLSRMFQASSNLWFSLITTGIIALLFQSVRTYVQQFVNQLLYGHRDEPSAVVRRLGRRLAEALPPDEVLPTIVQTVARDLRLPYVAIAVRQPDGEYRVHAEVGAPRTVELAFPLRYQGEFVGELIVTPRSGEADLGAVDRRVLEDLANQAGAMAHAVRLTDALQRSREQLVAAREEERRRLRRDLHDGLGPALATITLQSDTARDLVLDDPEMARAVLCDLTEQAQTTMTDVRRLIHALRPPVLDDLGLAAALQALAASLDRADLHIIVETPESVPELGAATEVAVYRIVQEALMNVIKHSEARSCIVRLVCDDRVHLEISDDGVGLADTVQSGVGLISIRERAEELGGSCTIESGQHGGSAVRVELPLGGRDGDDPRPDR